MADKPREMNELDDDDEDDLFESTGAEDFGTPIDEDIIVPEEKPARITTKKEDNAARQKLENLLEQKRLQKKLDYLDYEHLDKDEDL